MNKSPLYEKNNTSVYRATTEPTKNEKKNWLSFKRDDDKCEPSVKVKKPRRDKSDLGENFTAPDGGWAWVVCIAVGVSNLTIYPCLQQFGFLFRERLNGLGMSSSEITTIINTNSAISACTGLLNGPMFRRYTFRQVAMAGSAIIFTGIMLTAFCETFITYMLSYSVLFGFGIGISVSASSLALNTYFKLRRRRAAGFAWTVTGLGPIFFPYIVTFLLAIYGVQGTVLIFAGISLHTMVAALIYQPVRYHAPQPELALPNGEPELPKPLCKFCELQNRKQMGIFSSQYLYQDNDEDMPGYEITEPGTPMLSRANDGWFGSKLSLSSNKLRFRTNSSAKDMEALAKLNTVISEEVEDTSSEEFFKPNNFNRERDEILKHSNSKANFNFQLGMNDSLSQLRCTCAEEKALLEITQLQPQSPISKQSNNNNRSDGVAIISGTGEEEVISSTKNIPFLQKVITFFDLDLLRDFTYVNLVIGLTIINFGELNFSILTPFILNDFGFDTSQTTLAISVLAVVDITVRFFVPFFTEKIPWDNRVFFLIGVVGIAFGRTVVACTRSFPLILSCFAWIGLGKGVRTIFWPLIIPSCVPLKRLPAASGLQLLISGLFTLIGGPFVGLIRDHFDYSVTLHFLNMMTFIAAISWTTEALVRRHRKRRSRRTQKRGSTPMRT